MPVQPFQHSRHPVPLALLPVKNVCLQCIQVILGSLKLSAQLLNFLCEHVAIILNGFDAPLCLHLPSTIPTQLLPVLAQNRMHVPKLLHKQLQGGV